MPRNIKDEEVFERDGFRCVYCGHDGSTFEGWAFLQVDHWKPRSKGGTDDLENLVTSCSSCNFMKSDREWPTVDAARAEMAGWRAGMLAYFKEHVRPRLGDHV
jgi:5-methylcytosine-specific restriction endonuclease McrA